MRPDEEAFYSQLYAMADKKNKGRVSAGQSKKLFPLSSLPTKTLAKVWKVAAGKDKALSRDRFFVALRCIALAQQHLPFTESGLNSHPNLALPVFENIRPNAPPAASPATNVHPSQFDAEFANMSMDEPELDEWAMTAAERGTYDEYFATADLDGDSIISPAEGKQWFEKSGVQRKYLRKIWQLADCDRDRKLNKNEFAVAMHFVIRVKLAQKSNSPAELPKQLPASLEAVATGKSRFGNAPSAQAEIKMSAPVQDIMPVFSAPPPIAAAAPVTAAPASTTLSLDFMPMDIAPQHSDIENDPVFGSLIMEQRKTADQPPPATTSHTMGASTAPPPSSGATGDDNDDAWASFDTGNDSTPVAAAAAGIDTFQQTAQHDNIFQSSPASVDVFDAPSADFPGDMNGFNNNVQPSNAGEIDVTAALVVSQRNDVAELRVQAQQSHANIISARSDFQTSQEESQTLANEQSALENEIAEHEAEIKRIYDDNEELRNRHEEQRQAIEKLRERKEDTLKQLQESKQSAVTIQQDIEDMATETSQLDNEIITAEQEINRLRSSLKAVEERRAGAKTIADARKVQLGRLKQEKMEIADLLADASRQLRLLQGEATMLKEQLPEQQETVQQLREQYTEAQEILEMETKAMEQRAAMPRHSMHSRQPTATHLHASAVQPRISPTSATSPSAADSASVSVSSAIGAGVELSVAQPEPTDIAIDADMDPENWFEDDDDDEFNATLPGAPATSDPLGAPGAPGGPPPSHAHTGRLPGSISNIATNFDNGQVGPDDFPDFGDDDGDDDDAFAGDNDVFGGASTPQPQTSPSASSHHSAGGASDSAPALPPPLPNSKPSIQSFTDFNAGSASVPTAAAAAAGDANDDVFGDDDNPFDDDGDDGDWAGFGEEQPAPTPASQQFQQQPSSSHPPPPPTLAAAAAARAPPPPPTAVAPHKPPPPPPATATATATPDVDPFSADAGTGEDWADFGDDGVGDDWASF
jgi:predicted  nucleic acid-binding Zn-ribbon protein